MNILEILGIIFIILVAALIPVLLVAGPEIIRYVESAYPEPVPAVEPMPADMLRYLTLKNDSCRTLNGSFLIVTEDVALADMEGLVGDVPGEREAAERIADGYSFNQTTKTYALGDWLKKVVIEDGEENTTLWKEGRVYECAPDCTMRLMDSSETAAYYDELWKTRHSCAYFGKTPLPSGINMTMLLSIDKTGLFQMGSFRCENFLISSNKTYAKGLLDSNISLTDDQAALLWALARLDAPIQECLDESTGIIVYRYLSLDLTDAYLFDFSQGGHMRVNQQTTLKYFQEDIPESFLGLPS